MLPIKDTVPSRHFPWVTVTLILANFVVFLHQLMLPPGAQAHFMLAFAVHPNFYFRLSNYFSASLPNLAVPLFTSMFLHGGWLHLLSNMLFLWIFGDNIEDRLGPLRYFIFYITCGVIAAITYILSDSSSALPVIGASGAIAGVLGAYFLRFPTAKVKVLFPLFGFYPIFFHVPAILFLGLWFLLQVNNGMAATAGNAGGVAWWAHIGGFLAGMVLMGRFEPKPRTWDRAARRHRVWGRRT